MAIQAHPELSGSAHAALERALADAGSTHGQRPEPFRSPWWRLALEEATEDEPDAAGYAPSPRSTRGATRA